MTKGSLILDNFLKNITNKLLEETPRSQTLKESFENEHLNLRPTVMAEIKRELEELKKEIKERQDRINELEKQTRVYARKDAESIFLNYGNGPQDTHLPMNISISKEQAEHLKNKSRGVFLYRPEQDKSMIIEYRLYVPKHGNPYLRFYASKNRENLM